MGSTERRERERQETRTKILDAARELFAAHGFEAVTMRKIADKIEYTPTAIYFHFKDKEALIHELCVTDFLSFGEKFAQAATVKDPIARLKEAGRLYAEFAQAHPNSYRVMFMQPGKQLPVDEPHRGDPSRDAYAFLKWTVGEAIASGRIRAELHDVELLSQVIWAAVHGVVSLEIAKGCDRWIEWASFDARLDATIDVLVRGIETARPRGEGSAKPGKAGKR